MAESNLERLKQVLDELFMFDRADLDFGLYRIMNVRREEIRRFLDQDLLPTVSAALGQMHEGERAAIAGEKDALEKSLRDAGVDPDTSPKFRELSERYDADGNTEADEAEVYGYLVSFFRRYYKEGDFISLRRYKEGVYAIPYEGEEVKLHWANADQYYIKSTEQFRDYTFLVSAEDEPERHVHFKVVDADTERNNNRSRTGQERRFVLAVDDPIAALDNELVLRFEYRPADGAKQKALNEEIETAILGDPVVKDWRAALGRDVRREGAKDALTLLRKHLDTYTAKNSFDYFIHKDLGGFLKRELDFYIKNEVLRLDDIDTPEATGATLDAQLRKIKAIRAVGLPIIEFLASLEEFQKRLWLKKKFVVDTHWCVTLDRVPRELYSEIAANERQREEWVRLFAIDEIAGDVVTASYSEPLTEAFLEENQYLALDTSYFEHPFTERLLASIDDLVDATDGLLVHGENFQALRQLQTTYRDQINCIYIDPPYNTGSDGFPYRDAYQHSSWLAMMQQTTESASLLLSPDGAWFSSIDHREQPRLQLLLDDAFGPGNRLATISVAKGTTTGQDAKAFGSSIDYLLAYRRTPAFELGGMKLSERDTARFTREDELGRYSLLQLRKTGNNDRREDRPNLYYALTAPDGSKALPTGPGGYESRWRAGQATVERWAEEGLLEWVTTGNGLTPYVKYYLEDRTKRPSDLWDDIGLQEDPLLDDVEGNKKATRELKALFGNEQFDNPKPTDLIQRVLNVASVDSQDLTMDYFSGSGTTGHAVIQMNRADGGQRKYLLVEMGEYFDTVLKPRILKAGYAKDWKDGKPIDREGVSQLIKVIRLESYEDTLTNLRVRQSREQAKLLEKRAGDSFRRQYQLQYWLNAETRGSASLLDVEQFEDPWAYTLEVGQGSAAETKPVTVDLVETFNYLLGLRLQHVDHIRGATLVQGTLPPAAGQTMGEKALIVWRQLRAMDAEALEKFLWGQRINPRDLEFDVIYVNGDNHLENSRRPDETWKVRLIEDEFQRLMFETAEQERR